MKATLTPHGDAVREILAQAEAGPLSAAQLLVVRSVLTLWADARDAAASPDEARDALGQALAAALNLFVPLDADTRSCTCQRCRMRSLVDFMGPLTRGLFASQVDPSIVNAKGGMSLDFPRINAEVAGHG